MRDNKRKWKNIIQMIYQKYPFLRGDMMALTFILGTLDAIEYDKDNRIENWGRDNVKQLVDLIADTLVEFFAKYDNIARAQVKRE